MHRERAGYRDALLLATGKGGGVLVGFVTKPNFPKQFQRLFPGFVLADTRNDLGRERHVAESCEVRKQFEVLEHHPCALTDCAKVDALSGDIDTFEDDLAAGHALQAVGAAQGRRFAGAAWPDEAYHLAFMDAERNAAERFDLPVGFDDLFEPDQRSSFAGEAAQSGIGAYQRVLRHLSRDCSGAHSTTLNRRWIQSASFA